LARIRQKVFARKSGGKWAKRPRAKSWRQRGIQEPRARWNSWLCPQDSELPPNTPPLDCYSRCPTACKGLFPCCYVERRHCSAIGRHPFRSGDTMSIPINVFVYSSRLWMPKTPKIQNVSSYMSKICIPKNAKSLEKAILSKKF